MRSWENSTTHIHHEYTGSLCFKEFGSSINLGDYFSQCEMRKRIDVHETAEDSCKCITTVTQLDRIVRWRIERDTRAGVQYLSPWSPVEICSTFASSIKGNDGCDWCLLLPPWPFTHKDYFPLFSESILTIFVLLVQLQSTSLNHEVCVVKQHKKEWKISFKLCKKSHYHSKKIKKNREREREVMY